MAAGDPGHYIQCRSTQNGDTFNVTLPSTEGLNGDVQLHKDSETFTHSTSSNQDDVTVEADGHYLFLCNQTFIQNTMTSYFSPHLLLSLNSTLLDCYGKASMFIHEGEAADSAISCATILDLTDGDTVEFRVCELSTSTGDAKRGTDLSGWTVIKLDDTWAYFRASVTAGTDDLEVNDTDQTMGDITWTTTPDEKDSGYTHSTGTDPEEITLDAAGYYLVLASLCFFNTSASGQQRTCVVCDATINGTHVDGSYVSDYERNYPDGSFDTGYINFAKIIKTTSANDVLKLRAMHVNSQTTSHAAITERGITIVKLPDDADYIRLRRETNMETNAADDVDWDVQVEVDTASFGHSTGTNPERIDLNQSALCLFTFNAMSKFPDYAGSGDDYVSTGFAWKVDGTENQYGRGGTFNRAFTGSSFKAGWSGRSCLSVIDMADGEYLSIGNVVLDGAEPDCEHLADEVTIEGVNVDSLFGEPPATFIHTSIT